MDKNHEAIFRAYLAQQSRKFPLDTFCFDKQLAFVSDPAPFKTAVCSRRAGKTVGCAADLISTANNFPKTVSLYITLSRTNAKRLIWPELLEINESFKLGGKPNETELSLRFANKSVIYVSGAKDQTEIDKFRGLALKKAYIDECQSFRDYIRNLVDEVISKALFDHAGTLCLTGTPGPVPAGYFYECATNPAWSHHAWTMFDNPWLEKKSGMTVSALIERDLKRKGVTLNDPTIQRECFGRWVIDENALVFRYNAALNHWEVLPTASTWHYVLGIDLGYDDADAIAVLGWNDNAPKAYLIEELVKPKQGITELANQVQALIAKYNPDNIVMDTGGLGKKIAEEMQTRFSLPIVAAEKVRKFEYIEILNDAMRTGSFMAQRRSQFAQDCMLVEWDRDADKLKIKDTYHSDICDAVLYAFREVLHWLYEAPKPVLKSNTPEWFLEEERKMEAKLEEELRLRQEVEDLGWGGV